MGTMFAVTSMGRSKIFYRDILRLKITSETEQNVTFNGMVSLQTLDTWVRSIQSDYVMTDSRSFEMYFETDEFDSILRNLRVFDVEFVHEPMIRQWGQKFVRVYDPDRHIVEVAEAIDIVIKRFAAEGMSAEEISEKMKLNVDFIRRCLNEN